MKKMSQQLFEKAIYSADVELCKKIMSAEKVNFTSANGLSVIWLINIDDFSEKDRAVLALLLLHRVNLNSVNNYGQTLLHKAVENNNYKTTSLIVEYDIDIDKKDFSSQTALNYAIFNCSLDMCAMLIEKGADVNSCDAQGWTPIMHLATKNFSQVVAVVDEELDALENLLVSVSDLRQRNYDKHTVLHICKFFHNKRLYSKIKTLLTSE